MIKSEQQNTVLPENVQKVIDQGFDQLSEFISNRCQSILRRVDLALIKIDKQTYRWLSEDISSDLENAARRLKSAEIIDPHQRVPLNTDTVVKRRDQYFGAYLQAIAFDHDRRLFLRHE